MIDQRIGCGLALDLRRIPAPQTNKWGEFWNMINSLEARIGRIEDERDIRNCLHLYCRGVDRREPEILRQLFWEDSEVEYGMFAGNGLDFANALCGWFDDGGVHNTSHLLGNVTIALEGDHAFSEAYLHAHHRLTNAGGGYYDSIFGCRYQDRFERRGGTWKIAFRRLVFDWFRDFSDTGDWDVGSMGVNRENATIGGPHSDLWAEFNAALPGIILPR